MASAVTQPRILFASQPPSDGGNLADAKLSNGHHHAPNHGALPLHTVTQVVETTLDKVLKPSDLEALKQHKKLNPAEILVTAVSISDGKTWVMFRELIEVAGKQMLGIRTGAATDWIKVNFRRETILPKSEAEVDVSRALQLLLSSHAVDFADFPAPPEGQVQRDLPTTMRPDGVRQRFIPIDARALNLSPAQCCFTHPIKEHILHITPIKAEGDAPTSRHAPTEQMLSAVNVMKQGDPVSFQYPFQWSTQNGQRVLSAGALSFPKNFPDWNSRLGQTIRFLRGKINETQYPIFLEAIAGCYPTEIGLASPILAAAPISSAIAERMKAIKAAQKAKKADAAVGNTTADPSEQGTRLFCFKPRPENHARVQRNVGESGNIIFAINRKDADPIYLVDAPRVCAIYIFVNEQDAIDWATRSISFDIARQRAIEWVPHRTGWEKDTDMRLGRLGAIGY